MGWASDDIIPHRCMDMSTIALYSVHCLPVWPACMADQYRYKPMDCYTQQNCKLTQVNKSNQ